MGLERDESPVLPHILSDSTSTPSFLGRVVVSESRVESSSEPRVESRVSTMSESRTGRIDNQKARNKTERQIELKRAESFLHRLESSAPGDTCSSLARDLLLKVWCMMNGGCRIYHSSNRGKCVGYKHGQHGTLTDTVETDS